MLLRSILESVEDSLIEAPIFQEDLLRALTEEVALIMERPGGGQNVPPPTGKPPTAKPTKMPSTAPKPPRRKKPVAPPPAQAAPPAAPPPPPPGKTPGPAAGPRKTPKRPAPTPAPAPSLPQSVKRCPVGSRKDRQTGHCRELTGPERHGLKAAAFHRSASHHQSMIRDGGMARDHVNAVTHQGNAHAALGMHHAHMRRAQATPNDIQRHYHMAKADEYMRQAQKHLGRRNQVMTKMNQPSLGRRIVNRIGSLFTRPRPAPAAQG